MKEIDIKFGKYITHAYIEGELNKNSKVLLMLHGGPGYHCSYLKPLFDLSKYGYTVISYDQLGGGKSSKIDDTKLYTFKTYVNELDNLVKKLKLNNFDLLGHSWGGQLALVYLLNKKNTVNHLILFSSLSSSKLWSDSNYKICLSLLKDKKEIDLLKKAYKENNFFGKDINKLVDKKLWNMFYKVDLNTSPYIKPKYKKPKNEIKIYEYMWGKNDLFTDGTLGSWDITNKLNKIKNKTLIIHGKYDQSTDEVNKAMLKNIKNSKEVYLSKSGHGGYYSEYKKVITSIREFLNK